MSRSELILDILKYTVEGEECCCDTGYDCILCKSLLVLGIHSQFKLTRKGIVERLKIKRARNKRDAYKKGIHLLTPDKQELDDARERASRDGFEAIYIHSKGTWP